MTVRVRVPSWAAGPPGVVLNGTPLRGTVTGGWITVLRRWAQDDRLEVTLPMRLAFHPAPDAPSVQAASYGPVVLAGRGVGTGYADPDAAADAIDDAALLEIVRHPASAEAAPPQPPPLPLLDTASVRRTAARPMTFAATADGRPVTLVPVARAQHEAFTVYWRTQAELGHLPPDRIPELSYWKKSQAPPRAADEIAGALRARVPRFVRLFRRYRPGIGNSVTA
jgi:hypothetical protein